MLYLNRDCTCNTNYKIQIQTTKIIQIILIKPVENHKVEKKFFLAKQSTSKLDK